MARATSKYIRVDGTPMEYEFERMPYSQRYKRPKCPHCCKTKTRGGTKLRGIAIYKNNKRIRIGWLCDICHDMFITIPFNKLFKAKEVDFEGNETGGRK